MNIERYRQIDIDIDIQIKKDRYKLIDKDKQINIERQERDPGQFLEINTFRRVLSDILRSRRLCIIILEEAETAV